MKRLFTLAIFLVACSLAHGQILQQIMQAAPVAFPGFTYDQWIDFEGGTNGAAPTVATLNASRHVATGTWTIPNGSTGLTYQTATQGTETGTTGTLGYQYSNNPTGTHFYIDYALPAGKNPFGTAFFLKTGSCTVAFTECNHDFILFNASGGDLYRVSDERDTVGNTQRQLRLSPCTSGTANAVAITDAASYWIIMQYTSGSPATMKVYTPSYSLVGSVTCNASVTGTVTDILIGSNLGALNATFTFGVDDVFMCWTTPSNCSTLP